MTEFNQTQKAKCIIWFAELKDLEKVRENFRLHYCHFGENVPTPKEIFRWYLNFYNNGSVNDDHPIDIHTTTYEPQHGILNLFGFKVHKCHPYKMRLMEEHSDKDLVDRKKFAELELRKIQISLNYYHKTIWFGGEAKFYTNGRVDCHNFVYMSEESKDPEYKHVFPPSGASINVWAALSAHGIIGPYMTEEDLNKKTYQIFLRKFIYELSQIEQNKEQSPHTIFMHDDSSIHEEVNEFLDQEFKRKWIGPGSNYTTWPKLSPDLHPLCFFLWGYIKSKVYNQPIEANDTTELSHRIYHAFMEITPDMLKHAIKAYKERLKMVAEANGNWVDQHNEEKERAKRASDMETIAWLTRLEKGNFLK